MSPPLLAQAQLQLFLDAGYLEPHLAYLAAFLRPRRDALLDAFAGLPDGATWTRPDGGYFLWLELPERLDAADVNDRAAEVGVSFVPGAGFFADHPRRSSARLSFSYPSVDEIRTGAERLVELIRRRSEERTMTFNEQFFATGDQPVPGPAREIVGYGEHPPKVEFPGGAKVAVQIVINYEEGSEKTFAMGDGENDILYELPFKLDDQRDLAVESMYEYGTRAGIWRMFRIFDAAGIPVTFFAAAVALERNIEVAKKLAARGDEAASHGFRWSNHFEMTRDEEREAIKRAIESITRTVGTRPLGWYCREMSVNTRELVVEEGGFVYDSDCYNDDLPYWSRVLGKPHLVVPYGLVVNDARYVLAQGYSQPGRLLRDREGAPRPAAQRRRRRVADDVDRAAPSHHRQPGAVGRAGEVHRLRAGTRRRLVRPPRRHRDDVHRPAAEREVAVVDG